MDYANGNITVLEPLERYIALKQGVRYNTKVGYDFVLNLVHKEPFGQRIIRNIRASDAKLWFTSCIGTGAASAPSAASAAC